MFDCRNSSADPKDSAGIPTDINRSSNDRRTDASSSTMDTNREFVQQLMSKANEPMWTANAALAGCGTQAHFSTTVAMPTVGRRKRAIEEKIRKKAVYYYQPVSLPGSGLRCSHAQTIPLLLLQFVRTPVEHHAGPSYLPGDDRRRLIAPKAGAPPRGGSDCWKQFKRRWRQRR